MSRRRRILCFALGPVGLAPWLGVAPAATAQSRAHSGSVLVGRISEGRPGEFSAFLAAMRARGYADVRIEDRPARGHYEELASLAAELVSLRVDVIWSVGTIATGAAKSATTSIPIVMVSADAVGAGLVDNLARPGGNLTGLSLVSTDLTKKRLELLREIDPSVRRFVALATGPDSIKVPFVVEWLRQGRAAAAALGVPFEFVEIPLAPETWDAAFASLASVPRTAVAVVESPHLIAQSARLAQLTDKYHLPAIYAFQAHVDAGGLMSYGVTAAYIDQRVAHYVARVLDGAKPADLPVEQPTQFELAINLKAARALGLSIPTSLRLRANRLVE